jgi:hypothetical protein
MPTIQEVVDRRRILEEAREGMRRERVQQIKRMAGDIRNSAKQTFKPEGTKSGTKVQSAFLKTFAGVQPKSSKGNKSVGRPRNIDVHRSPLTGKPVPAQIYNKEMRFIRRRQQDMATQRQLQLQQQFANRGITPQQAQMIELQRQLQARQVQMQPRQMPTQQVISMPPPTQIQAQQPSIWRRQGYLAEEVDILGNRKQVVRGTPQSFWN